MRLGISIPNELHRRLEPLKQYINVSQVCREAIEDRIRCYEYALASGSDQDIVSAMERTWNEELKMRAVIEVDWRMLGCEDAKSWVTAAQLPDWNYLHDCEDAIRKQGRQRWEVALPHLQGAKTFHERMSELDDRIQQQDDHFFDWLYERGGIDRGAVEREYMSAWLAYTDSAWDLVQEKRKRHVEERHRKKLEAQEKEQNPTVPEELFRELDEDSG